MTGSPSDNAGSPAWSHLFSDHSRNWYDNVYVYPVISRRSEGLSIGINLNPDKVCNFNCIYCQVDRSIPSTVHRVDLERLGDELDAMIRLAASGELFRGGPLAMTPPSLRTMRDIAFSGDGEPTASPVFLEAVQLAARLRKDHALDTVRLRVITDAAFLGKQRVKEALSILHANNGEIWAKLDAGTEEYFRIVNRAHVPLAGILENILQTARKWPVVIQSLWMKIHDRQLPEKEVDAFACRLKEIVEGGGKLQLIQIYTVARLTAENYVTALEERQLEEIAHRVRAVVPVPVRIYGA